MLQYDQLDETDRAHFLHPSTHVCQLARGEITNRVITSGEGVYIRERDGTKLLDAFSGRYCVNVGYGRKEIAEAISKQPHELAYYHAYAGHGTEASITLSGRMAALGHRRPFDVIRQTSACRDKPSARPSAPDLVWLCQ